MNDARVLLATAMAMAKSCYDIDKLKFAADNRGSMIEYARYQMSNKGRSARRKRKSRK